MILALKGKLAAVMELPKTPYGDLLDALAGMGYDRRAAVDALTKAEAELKANFPQGADKAEKEKLLFKQAIVNLSGS